MTVIFHVYLWHLVTLEQMNSVHVMTHSIYQKRWRMPYIHSIGYKHEFSPNNKCCHIPVIWQVYDTTCHMTGIWQTYTLSKLSGDSRWQPATNSPRAHKHRRQLERPSTWTLMTTWRGSFSRSKPISAASLLLLTRLKLLKCVMGAAAGDRVAAAERFRSFVPKKTSLVCERVVDKVLEPSMRDRRDFE